LPAILSSLDFKTLIFTVSLLTLMLSVLLAFARIYAEGIAGIGYLAAGNLAIGLGMIAILSQLDNLPRYLIPGIALIALGNGLYINGIQSFFGRKPRHYIPLALAAAVIVIDLVCVVLQQNMRAAILGNTSIHLLANAGCAFLLIRNGRQALYSPYGFTALLFLIMSLLMLARIFVVANADPAAFQSVLKWPINKFTFLWAGAFQLCITFGFVLMLHYRMAERLRSFAAHDWLTGALNRRYLEESALRMVANCRRVNIGLAVLLFDLDHFKKVNDRFGHQVGDEVIKSFAAIVQSTIRAGDLFGRYGGEEFCVLLPNASEEDALTFAERIRAAFERETFTFRNETFQCSVSAGVSNVALAGSDVERLIAAADLALYQSKASGRNRTTAYSALQRTEMAQSDAQYSGVQAYRNALS
jgi:diguanylate cyclase (GGDEF)-like protein